ncbi:MAG: S-methyl-5-thioribose-1-phosphate isomerase [Hyphomicrobiaceae bacterium]
MKVNGRHYQAIWLADDGWSVEVIDQTRLPHVFTTARLSTLPDAARAIRTMQVRGAPLIGVTAAYGLCLALRSDASDGGLDQAIACLASQRPTAVNLRWALEEMRRAVLNLPRVSRVAAAYARAARMAQEDTVANRSIGEHGSRLLEDLYARKKSSARLNVLTHCNAGWLATVDWGTATAPIYCAHDKGLPLHVWVDETRPRNQGTALTAFELGAHGVPHTIIADNAGGHLMQRGEVDIVIVGADRVTANGDAANKIGTYLKALAARDTNVPFYVAMPYSTIDWSIESGENIPIEERSPEEVLSMTGRTAGGEIIAVQIAPSGSPAANPAFDITPSRLITGLITERGITPACGSGLLSLYPERQTTGMT